MTLLGGFIYEEENCVSAVKEYRNSKRKRAFLIKALFFVVLL